MQPDDRPVEALEDICRQNRDIRSEAALEAARLLVERRGTFSDRCWLAWHARLNGQLGEAKDAIEQALECHPQYPQAMAFAASLAQEMEEIRERGLARLRQAHQSSGDGAVRRREHDSEAATAMRDTGPLYQTCARCGLLIYPPRPVGRDVRLVLICTDCHSAASMTEEYEIRFHDDGGPGYWLVVARYIGVIKHFRHQADAEAFLTARRALDER